ncbi:MAG: inositol monophosphatase family protein [Candidatus Promineifilaceae bacterium]
MPSQPDIPELRQAAEEAARLGGRLAAELLSQPRQVASKGFRDLVTDADFASQAAIISYLRQRYPGHGFVAEESAAGLPRAGDVLWLIDPVDGTTNYSREIPLYSVSVAAYSANGDGGTGLAGAIYDPSRDELFSAGAGRGASLNGRPIRVSRTAELAAAIPGVDWSHAPALRERFIATLNGFAHKVHTTRAIGSAALALAWVAVGRLDAYINFSLAPWDVAAGQLLVHEAGGRLTDVDDTPWRLEGGGCVASNGRLHDAFMQAAGLIA